MSSALAIAAITATLKALLEDHLARQSVAARVGDVAVTALPPDRLPTGAEERSALNLFLYHVKPHARLRPLATADGEPAALTLDLFYLLAAYGQNDLHAEILLGYAMQVLLETAALTPATIEGAILRAGEHGHSAWVGDGTADVHALAERTGPVEVSPEFLSVEETAKLWSALQARYRPCAAYKVSSVVIQRGQ